MREIDVLAGEDVLRIVLQHRPGLVLQQRTRPVTMLVDTFARSTAPMSDMSMQQIRERIDRQRSQLYLVLMQPTEHYDTASEQGAELMRRHLQWQLELQDRNMSLGAGPFGDLGGAQSRQQFEERVAPHADMLNASGMYILAAPSREDAEAIARAEPFEAAGWRRHTVVLWNLNEGAAWQLAQQLLAAAGSVSG